MIFCDLVLAMEDNTKTQYMFIPNILLNFQACSDYAYNITGKQHLCMDNRCTSILMTLSSKGHHEPLFKTTYDT